LTKLVYVFPEPLPLPRARGLQTVNTAVALAEIGVEVELIHAGSGTDPIAHYGLKKPSNLTLREISRALPWPLHRTHSNRLFFRRLASAIKLDAQPIYARHLKLAAMLVNSTSHSCLIYEAHEVFSDTAGAGQKAKRFQEERDVMRGAAAVVTNTAATARRLSELHGAPRHLEVIPNGVAYSDVPPGKDWENLRREIIYSGSLFPWKGVAELVAAASQLPPDLRIRVVGGQGERLAQMQQSAGKGGAALEFHGQQPHAEVMRMLNAACIAVLPNRRDTDSEFTSPIKLFEYMAAGCAIVTSDLPSIREILGEDDALWCEPGDPASLARGIAKLAENPQLARAMGARVREKARQFTWLARAEKIRQLTQTLLKAA
jgi:glycosyltransferase involved in cell wall biosynthesis